jgi:oxalate decarboxylase/phosphoglucose isomerase-like protein (cupin superfamily)
VLTTSLHAAGQDGVTVGRDRIRFTVTSDRTAGEVAVFDVRIPPGGGPPMLHRHDPFELYRVRRGELVIYLEGADGGLTRTVAGPGTVVAIGGGLEHTVRNESDDEAEALVVFCPGEPMERFARAAGELGHEATEAEVLTLAEASGIEMTRSIPDTPASLSP